ncbi:MAG: caspase domain-containing protein [Bacteroidaceae bacterium]
MRKGTFLFWLLLCFALAAGCPAEAKTYLVSVGIADYPGTDHDLRLPANDAKTIAWLYSKNTNVEYKQLLDRSATKEAIVKAIRTLFAKASAGDIVVFFFSGHGYPGGFCAYDANLTYAEIRKAMAGSQSKNKMIFADACFSGKLREGKTSASATSATKKANVMLFLSSRSNETSIERRDMENGFFTTYLQKGLRGNADANRDRTITARELFDFVSKGVVSLSGGRQHPVMWGKFSDHMPVMKW